MSAIAGQVLVRLCYCTFLFGKDKQWYTSRPKTQGRRSAQSKRECLHVRVCICVCVYVCLCARAHEWVCVVWGQEFLWSTVKHTNEPNSFLMRFWIMKQMPGRFLAVLCSSILIHDMQMVCDFFSLELITGVTSANEIIQYPAFCRILWHFSLSLSGWN